MSKKSDKEVIMIGFEEIKTSPEILSYIESADMALKAVGYTEHGAGHVMKCAVVSGNLLKQLGYDDRTVELAMIAGYMHDIGNLVNREGHAQSGALIALSILTRMGMSPSEAALVASAIGRHDERAAFPVNPIAAALILADKTDVRRSRVRSPETMENDIHDRVNYAAVDNAAMLDESRKTFTLTLTIDVTICSVMDYFEIFLTRMQLCRQAAEALGLSFKLVINNTTLL